MDRARLLPNGNILVQRGGMTSTDGVVEEYDWEGKRAWLAMPEGKVPHENFFGPHHDVWRKEDGNTLTICRHPVPPEYLKGVREPTWQNQTICGDSIIEFNPAGETVWEWHSHGHLDINHYRLLASPGWHAGPHNSTVVDWTHINTVQALPENRHFDAGDERFRPGNVLISPRSYRYPYDHCPQTAALGKPKELRVTPPRDFRIPPDEARE